MTIKLKDGTTRTFTVKGNVNLDSVDPGDTVRITVEKKQITSIEVEEEDDD